MTGSTTYLHIPYVDPSQSEPEVPINAGADIIDAALHALQTGEVGEGGGGGGAGGVNVSDSTTSPPIVALAVELKFEGAGVTVTRETGPRAVITIPGGGGGGGGSTSGLLCNDAIPLPSTNTGWDDTSLVAIVSGNFLKAPSFSSIKFKLVVKSGSYQVGSAVVRHLDHDTTAFTSSVAVTWGGVANPLFTTGSHESDAISVAIDKDSDLWIIVYGSAGSPNTTAGLGQGAQYAGSIIGGYAAGDHTADSTTFSITAPPNVFGLGQVYGA